MKATDIKMASARFGLVAIAIAMAGLEAAASSGNHQRVEQKGIAVEFAAEPLGESLQLQEGEPARFSFLISDTTAQTPLSGVFPAAWMDRRPPNEIPTEAGCKQKVEAFIGGGLLNPAELDLNVYYVLAMNQDATISVVDPLFGFGTTKLLDMIFLDSPGEDWVLSANGQLLFVSQPEAQKIAVVDTATWEVTHQMEVAGRPQQLTIQDNGRMLWATLDGDEETQGGVAAIDLSQLQTMAHLPLGSSPADMVLGPGDRHLYIALPNTGQLAIVDTFERKKVANLDLGGSPSSLGYSSLADTIYAVDGELGAITVLNAENNDVLTKVEAEPGLGGIFVAPDGRLAFVVNGRENLLHLLDTSSNRIVQTGTVESGPEEVAFSDHLAYIRHQGSETVLMIPFGQVGTEGEPIPMVDFPGGHTPFGSGSRPSSAAGIVQAPGATAVLVANPADRAIYYYKEGMAAPMGHFQNYGKEPRAVLALDRSLREKSTGSYETTAVLRRPGIYDVAFFLDSPRTVFCLEIEVLPNPSLEANRKKVLAASLALADDSAARVGRANTLRFRLMDTTTGDEIAGLEDLRVLTFRGPGLEQSRRWARPLLDGSYEIELRPTRTGSYQILASSVSASLVPERTEPASIWVSETQEVAP